MPPLTPRLGARSQDATTGCPMRSHHHHHPRGAQRHISPSAATSSPCPSPARLQAQPGKRREGPWAIGDATGQLRAVCRGDRERKQQDGHRGYRAGPGQLKGGRTHPKAEVVSKYGKRMRVRAPGEETGSSYETGRRRTLRKSLLEG